MTAGPTTPWRGGRHVDEAEALRLVADRFPHLRPRRARLLGVGWDNTAHVVDDVWLFRFPRRRQGADLTARELLVLPRLAPRLPLAVPAPELVGAAGRDFPWAFTGAPFVPGVEWWVDPPSDRVAAAVALADALVVLHSTAVAGALADVLPRLPVDPNRRADPVERARRTAPALARLVEAGRLDGLPDLTLTPDRLRALAAAAEEGPPGATTLVHGDLHVRHVLVHDGRPSGLVDWGNVCVAEVSLDLQVAYALLDGTARSAFLERYGPVGPGVLARARLLAVSLHLMIADAAVDTGDVALAGAALQAVRRALDDADVGD